jgi:cysteine desulfurase / selenocysteine lyase
MQKEIMKKDHGKIDPKKTRRDFPMFAGQAGKHFVFLDSAASSQTPAQVLRAMDGFYKRCRANVHRGMYAASEQATEKYEAARRRVAEFIGAAPQEVIFTRGATESLNLLAYTLSKRLKAGDEVVLTVMEHHSNLVPWQQLAKKQGFSLKFIGLTPAMTLDMDEARRLITPATKVVAATHVSNAIGTVIPVKELAALAHARGAVMIVDAAQSAGHRPLNVSELDCDFLAFSGHKMLGPTGVGVLYGRRRLLEGLEPFLYGGDMILEVSLEDSVWNELPWKFEAGTPNIAGVIGLGAAVDYLDSLGLGAAREHERLLTAYALEKISAVKKAVVYGPPAGVDRGGVVSFTVGDIHPHDLSTILAEQGVCVRGGHHCAMPLMRYLKINGTTRASFSVYTTRQDIDALCRAIEKAKKIFKL